MSMKQNDAVFQVICEMRDVDGFKERVVLSREEKIKVTQKVSELIWDKAVVLSDGARAKYETLEKLQNGYVKGMVDNHLRKDKRLNGGISYEIQNPGSRAGASDEQLKALKALLSTLPVGSEASVEIEAAITHRQEELKLNKKKVATKAINIDALPEEFRHLVQ